MNDPASDPLNVEPDAESFAGQASIQSIPIESMPGYPEILAGVDEESKNIHGGDVVSDKPAVRPLERKEGKAPGRPSEGKNSRKVNGSKTSVATKQAIIALSRGNATNAEIQRRLHVGPSTVQTVLTAQAKWEDAKTVESIRKGNAAFWWVTSRRALESITDEKLSKSSALQVATIAAISTDKARLSEGLPTVRIEYQGQEDEALQARIAQLEGVIAQSDGYKVIQAEQVKP